jgi:hypothetical protein
MLTGRENLPKYAFWLGPGGLADKEIKLRWLKCTVLGMLPL